VKNLAPASIFIYGQQQQQGKGEDTLPQNERRHQQDAPREGAWHKDKMYVGGRVTLSCCGNIKNSPTNLCEAQGHHPK